MPSDSTDLWDDLDDFADGLPFQAVLICKGPLSPGIVKMEFPPKEYALERSVSTSSYGSTAGWGYPGGASKSIFRKSEPGTITLNDVLFSGYETKAKVDQLYNWMTPGGGLAGRMGGGAAQVARGGLASSTGRAGKALNKLLPGKVFKGFTAALPELTFIYGTSVYSVILKSCNVTVTRVDRLTGQMIRCKVRLTMTLQPSLLSQLPTNPTSGGLSGRSRHTMSDGDSLQSVAYTSYGSPGRWRALAEANGIDDPLRVRPGDPVFLPNDNELSGGR